MDVLGNDDMVKLRQPNLVAFDCMRCIRETQVFPSKGTWAEMLAYDWVVSEPCQAGAPSKYDIGHASEMLDVV